MKTDFTRLQGEQKMSWEDWYSELAGIYAKEMKLDKLQATRYINMDAAQEYWEDGFTPFGCFRENYQS